jgi:hypothetical protein
LGLQVHLGGDQPYLVFKLYESISDDFSTDMWFFWYLGMFFSDTAFDTLFCAPIFPHILCFYTVSYLFTSLLAHC